MRRKNEVEKIAFFNKLPFDVIESLHEQYKLQKGRRNEVRIGEVKRYLSGLGYEHTFHLKKQFYEHFLYGLDVTFKVSVPIVYKVIEDLGFGKTLTLQRSNAKPWHFLKLNKKITNNDVKLIQIEVKNRVKEHEAAFYNEYILPLEQIHIEEAIPEPNKYWWMMNKPKVPMSDKHIAAIIAGKSRAAEKRRIEREKLKSAS